MLMFYFLINLLRKCMKYVVIACLEVELASVLMFFYIKALAKEKTDLLTLLRFTLEFIV